MRTKKFRFIVLLSTLFSLMIVLVPYHALAKSNQSLAHQTSQMPATTYPLPSWWNGEHCDATHYQANNANHAASQVMATWSGIEACKPMPGTAPPPQPYNADVQFVPNPNNTTEGEWQCTELVKRWMLLAWGLPSVVANGDAVVSNYAAKYPSVVKQIVNNGNTHVLPKVGDVLSYSTVHTALVIGVTTHTGQGNATLNLLEQNASSTGKTNQEVISWVIKGGIDDPTHTKADAVSGWLTPRSWSTVSSPNPSTSHDELSAVSMSSPSDGWAVGGIGFGGGPMSFHWNGSSWTNVNVSSNLGTWFYGVDQSSTTNIWAVGYGSDPLGSGNNVPLIEQGNGSSWTQVQNLDVPSGATDNRLQGVSVLSSGEAWAVGYSYTTNEQVLVYHYTSGSGWVRDTSVPNVGTGNNNLFSVKAISSSDVWAVGTYVDSSGYTNTLTLHFDGSGWTHVTSPSIVLGNTSLTGVWASASNDVWAVGYGDSGLGNQTYILHYDGSAWHTVTSPNPTSSNVQLWSVSGADGVDAWAVGYYLPSGGGQYQPLSMRWNGVQWTLVSPVAQSNADNYLNGVAVTSGSDCSSTTSSWKPCVLTVGHYTDITTGHDQTLTEQTK